MDKLFDIDDLHKSYRKKRLRKVLIGVPIGILLLVVLLATVGHTTKTPVKVLATDVSNYTGDGAAANVSNASPRSAANTDKQRADNEALAKQLAADAKSYESQAQQHLNAANAINNRPKPTEPSQVQLQEVQGVPKPDPVRCAALHAEEKAKTAPIEEQNKYLSARRDGDLSTMDSHRYVWPNPPLSPRNQAEFDYAVADYSSVSDMIIANVNQINQISNPYIRPYQIACGNANP